MLRHRNDPSITISRASAIWPVRIDSSKAKRALSRSARSDAALLPENQRSTREEPRARSTTWARSRSLRSVGLAGVLQPAPCEGSDGLEELEPPGVRASNDETLGHEIGDRGEDRGPVDGTHYCFHAGKIEAGREHAESCEQRLARLVEEVEAPGDRAIERDVTFAASRSPTLRHVETIVEVAEQFVETEVSKLRRGEFDREWETIEATADVDDSWIVGRDLEQRVDGRGSGDEQFWCRLVEREQREDRPRHPRRVVRVWSSGSGHAGAVSSTRSANSAHSSSRCSQLSRTSSIDWRARWAASAVGSAAAAL